MLVEKNDKSSIALALSLMRKLIPEIQRFCFSLFTEGGGYGICILIHLHRYCAVITDIGCAPAATAATVVAVAIVVNTGTADIAVNAPGVDELGVPMVYCETLLPPSFAT